MDKVHLVLKCPIISVKKQNAGRAEQPSLRDPKNILKKQKGLCSFSEFKTKLMEVPKRKLQRCGVSFCRKKHNSLHLCHLTRSLSNGNSVHFTAHVITVSRGQTCMFYCLFIFLLEIIVNGLTDSWMRAQHHATVTKSSLAVYFKLINLLIYHTRFLS